MIFRRKIIIQIFNILFLIGIAACSRQWHDKEWWEGVRENKLRIFVEIDCEVEIIGNEENKNEDCSSLLRKAARKRAVNLLTSYISMERTGTQDMLSVRNKIHTISREGKVAIQKCSRERCWALFDFQIDTLK